MIKLYHKHAQTLLLAAAALTVLMLVMSGCARTKLATPDGSKPNEYSAYLFSAANVLYFDGHYERAEEIYRLALRFDPKSVEIRKALFNTLYNRITLNEIPLSYFEGYVDTLLTLKVMDRQILEQAYNVFARYEHNYKAKEILDIYMKQYESPRAYTSLFYLEQTLYNRTRPELLDKAFKLGSEDASFLNTLGYLYLAVDSTKAEQAWLQARRYDASPQSTVALWGLYTVQENASKLLGLYDSYTLPEEADKLEEVLDKVINDGYSRSLITVGERLLASDRPQFVLKLLQSSWAAEEDTFFERSWSRLRPAELSSLDRQLAWFYGALYALKLDRAGEALTMISRLDGKDALDELISIHRAIVLKDKTEDDTAALSKLKQQLRRVISPASEKQLSWQVKNYLLAMVDALKFDNTVEVDDEIAKHCVLWFYESDRSTYDTYLWLARYYQKTGKNINLKTILREALQEYPEDSVLLNWLGYSYVVDGYNLDEAEVLIRRALQLSPNNPYYLDSLAWLFYQKEDYQTALELMEIPSRLKIMPSEIAYHIARILVALKEFDAAVDYLNIAIKTNDDPNYVAQAQDLLRKINP